ncbi:MAG: SH3 domain-containing protein [Cyclobacteriaceae bacterium]
MALISADSLYNSKKYTEAFERYKDIYDNGQASPAMLGKMAFIQEGLGNYTSALYYLDHYYKKTSNKKVLEKMQDLAGENDLVGYNFSDYKFLTNNINKYQRHIIGSLSALSIFILALIYYKKPKGYKAVPWVSLQLIVVLPILLIVNEFFEQNEGIIKEDQTVLMEAPSAASEPIELISKGHKVKILSQSPVWTRIQYEDQEAYVRSNRLLRLF